MESPIIGFFRALGRKKGAVGKRKIDNFRQGKNREKSEKRPLKKSFCRGRKRRKVIPRAKLDPQYPFPWRARDRREERKREIPAREKKKKFSPRSKQGGRPLPGLQYFQGKKGGGSSVAAEDFIILLRTIVPLKKLKFRLAFICDE